MKTWLRRIAVGLLVLVLVLGAVGVWWVRNPWPQVAGSLTVAGLEAPVRVVRDEWGMPHIYAENDHDLLFAQGFVHAQDRLWQMEMNRSLGKGTLSAILGAPMVRTDRALRTLGLRQAAEAELAALDGASLALLEAYVAGVNAYLTTHGNKLPIEYALTGYAPQPWTALDTLVWGNVISYSLTDNEGFELLRARLIAEVGEARAQELLPPYDEGAPLIVPPEAQGYEGLRGVRMELPEGMAAALAYAGPHWGSNNWVVAGSHTESGKPLLANDTHLGLEIPSLWYQNGLHGGSFDTVGFSFPGVPLVIIGHNERIAWGVTNMVPDIHDYYLERVDDPVNPTRYEYEGAWYPVEVITETIEVSGGAAQQVPLRFTRHGPLVNGILRGLDEAEPLSWSWNALRGKGTFAALVALNQAHDWTSFRAALRDWEALSLNFVYADAEGNIGYQATGRIPLRGSAHQGLLPGLGWDAAYDWTGTLPFDDLPTVLNPPTGFIATANHKVVSDAYPHHLSYEWAAPYRAQRIADLIGELAPLTVEEIAQMQRDSYSLPAEALRPYLLAVEPASDLERRALAEVEGWDLRNEPDRVGAAIYHTWYWFMVRNTVGDELGEEGLEMYLDSPSYANSHLALLARLLTDPADPWFDDQGTDAQESRDTIIQRSLTDAVDWLAEQHGREVARWTWGRLHTVEFLHFPLGESDIRPLEKIFNSPILPVAGDSFSINAAWYAFDTPFAVTTGPSQRLIVDLGAWDNSRAVLTAGQSAHLFHPHRADMTPRWLSGHSPTLPFTPAATEANAEGTLTLTPP